MMHPDLSRFLSRFIWYNIFVTVISVHRNKCSYTLFGNLYTPHTCRVFRHVHPSFETTVNLPGFVTNFSNDNIHFDCSAHLLTVSEQTGNVLCTKTCNIIQKFNIILSTNYTKVNVN